MTLGFKKLAFMALATSLLTNSAFADCIESYAKAYELSKEGIKNSGYFLGAGVLSTGALVYSARTNLGPLDEGVFLITGIGVAAPIAGGVGGTGLVVNMPESIRISNILNLLKEAQVGQGVALNKYTKGINNKHKTSYSVNQVTDALRAINDDSSACMINKKSAPESASPKHFVVRQTGEDGWLKTENDIYKLTLTILRK